MRFKTSFMPFPKRGDFRAATTLAATLKVYEVINFQSGFDMVATLKVYEVPQISLGDPNK